MKYLHKRLVFLSKRMVFLFKKNARNFFLHKSPNPLGQIYQQSFSAILFVLSISFHIGTAQDYEFKKITTKDGLSHSTVYAIAQDHNGFIWIGTREGLNRFDSYEIKSYYVEGKSPDLPSNEIRSLLAAGEQLFVGTQHGLSIYHQDSDRFGPFYSGDSINVPVRALYEASNGKILIGTGNGLYVLDTNRVATQIIRNINIETLGEYKKNVFWVMTHGSIYLVNEFGETIKAYRHSRANGDNNTSRCLFTDSHQRVWLGTTNGLFQFDNERDQFIETELPLKHQPFIRSIAEDEQKRLWLGTETGLYIYAPSTKKLIHYDQSFSKAPNALSDRAIYKVFFSKENMVWIGTYFGGVNIAKLKSGGFKKLQAGKALSGKAVSEITQDSRGKLWIGTEDGGISIWDKKSGTFDYLNEANGLSSNNIHAICEDSHQNIWIGTFFGGLNRYDPSTGSIKSYTKSIDDPHSISNNYVYAIEEDKAGVLWIGTQRGLNRYQRETDDFSSFLPQTFRNKFIYDIHADDFGKIWVGTRFRGIYCYDQQSGQLDHFDSATHSISSDQIISITEDENHNLWFGTLEGGAIYWNRETNTFQNITSKMGLPNNNVYGIISTAPSTAWMSTNKGLCRYDPQRGKISIFNTSDGLTTNQFNFKSYFKDHEGNLYFGSVAGLNYFHPDSTLLPKGTDHVFLTDFKLFNKSVPIKENGILDRQINQTTQITLPHKENVITFEFVNINHSADGINRYTCYLENFEKNWNEIGNKRSATYTNLSPGQYTFRVKSNDSAERTVQLHITPPFWRSNWAIALYALMVSSLIVIYLLFTRFLNRQRLAVQVEKMEKEKIRIINQNKLDFFTFISHEFKHPISLIIASLEKFFQHNLHKISASDEVNSIKRNAKRLQELVNQLIEFRSIEEKHASLHLSKGDLVGFTRNILQSFKPVLEDRKIGFSFESTSSVFHCYFDPDKMEKINANVLSSLVNKIETGGQIQFSMDFSKSPEEDKMEVQFRYSVTNIDLHTYQEEFDKQEIFEIGWNLVRSLVLFLKGKMQIQNLGDGGAILIQIPIALKGQSTDLETITKKRDFFIEKNETVKPSDYPKQDFTIMILEQDRELLYFLTKHFSGQYKVLAVRSKREAQEKLNRHIPDLILADTFHNNNEGIELCKTLKSDPQTVHVPFIVLTIQTSEQKKLEALRAGAEMFLTKPFHLKKLELIIQNTLKSRMHLQNQFAALTINHRDINNLSNQDQKFLRMVTETIQQNYHRSDFSIPELAKKLDISRSLLHLKMKKITNASTSDFILEIRMKQACELLKGGMIIREVADKVGYNDPSYFSKAFKKKFGISPGKFVFTH